MINKKLFSIFLISILISFYSSISYSYGRVLVYNNEIVKQEDVQVIDMVLGFKAPNGYYRHDIYGNWHYSINNLPQWIFLGNTGANENKPYDPFTDYEGVLSYTAPIQ